MIVLDNVSKSFDGGQSYALRDVSLTIEEGETFVLVGTSGSGKTTILRLINRLIEPTSGRITLDGRDLSDYEAIALRRNMGYVFQGIGLFPHMTVGQNVAIGLRLTGISAVRRDARARELLELVELEPEAYVNRFPAELSGGQQQRVAVARALATDPNYLLMDEPFGALDVLTRDSLQKEVLRLKEKIRKTIVFVTHDIVEAFLLGDRVGVCDQGRLDQVGTKRELVEHPQTDFVRELLARPVEQLEAFRGTSMNVFNHIAAVVEQHGAELWLRTGEHIMLTGVSTVAAIAIGIPLGIFAAKRDWAERPLLATVGILQTVPSLAMLALLLTMIGQIGALPAIIALSLYALLPIVRNTVTGLRGIAPQISEAARGVGMTPAQQLSLVDMPLALPVIVAGVRTAAVVGVGIATLSAFIGAGGLGQFINRGLALSNTDLILLGAVPSALLALAVDGSIAAFQWGIETRRRAREQSTIWAARIATALPALILIVGAIAYVSTSGGLSAVMQGSSREDQATLRIGAKNFSESEILGEMIAQLIEAKTDLRVKRRFGFGGTMIVHGALERGQIDLYVEYTGTALTTILDAKTMTDPNHVFEYVLDAYAKRFHLIWLKPFKINNTYALAVTAQKARAHKWTTISDLVAEAAGLRAGFTPEYSQRPDGYPALRNTYGFAFGQVFDLDAALMYQAVARDEVDVVSAYATDGRIDAYNLYLLKDDRHAFPPYFAAPVVREAVLKAHPELPEILAPLSDLLDDKTMRALNWQVDGEKKSPRAVARAFLQSKDLLAAASKSE